MKQNFADFMVKAIELGIYYVVYFFNPEMIKIIEENNPTLVYYRKKIKQYSQTLKKDEDNHLAYENLRTMKLRHFCLLVSVVSKTTIVELFGGKEDSGKFQ